MKMKGSIIFSIFILCILFASSHCTPPQVISAEYQTKSVNLLSTTLNLNVIEVTTDQDLYHFEAVPCAPYSCPSTESIGCACDYTHNAPGL
jgi:hypothetical protein